MVFSQEVEREIGVDGWMFGRCFDGVDYRELMVPDWPDKLAD